MSVTAAEGFVASGCHAGIKNQMAKGKVQHDAVSVGKKCSNCHNPNSWLPADQAGTNRYGRESICR